MIILTKQTTSKQITDRLCELQKERDELLTSSKPNYVIKYRLMSVESELTALNEYFLNRHLYYSKS